MLRIAILFVFGVAPLLAVEVSDLRMRGYSVIPEPQVVRLADGNVPFGSGWKVEGDKAGIAYRTLTADLKEFHHMTLSGGSGGVLRLAVEAGTVDAGADAEISRQAYRLTIANDAIEIIGNDEPGLFYGVQTLLQLVKRNPAGELELPRCVIEDWPGLQLRFLHWDTKHHRDRMETLKRYLDWTARFKANMIGFELEDKFEYPSHPFIAAPDALTTEELQEIVDYGLERHIQVVPVIQSPAHMAYVLKHPDFAELKADGNNYQISLCDPRSYDLIFSMYDDVIAATKGVDYFYVSTDEYYYAGIDSRCSAPYNEENRSRQWAEFVQRARDHLAKHGRRPLAWVEYPLLPEHISMLPPDLIDGVIGNEEYLPAENEMGMRQMAYVSMQGGEYLFPNHLGVAGGNGVTTGRLDQARAALSHGRVWKGSPIGAFGAAWDDNGLHNETFWLGWSAVAQWSWHPGGASSGQHAAEFMRLYYGPGVSGMAEVYRRMQEQALAWRSTWDRVVSRARESGYGNSWGKGIGTTRWDLTLTPPSLPTLPALEVKAYFANTYGDYLEVARKQSVENAKLGAALHENVGHAERNRYNLEVFLSLSRFMGHHWQLLTGLETAEQSLLEAHANARENRAEAAVGHLVAAHNTVQRIYKDGEAIFDDLRVVYEKSRLPKGEPRNGKTFFHRLDDTKDHWADRTVDLGFMMQPERSLELAKWLNRLSDITREYARKHDVAVKGLAEARLEE